MTGIYSIFLSLYGHTKRSKYLTQTKWIWVKQGKIFLIYLIKKLCFSIDDAVRSNMYNVLRFKRLCVPRCEALSENLNSFTHDAYVPHVQYRIFFRVKTFLHLENWLQNQRLKMLVFDLYTDHLSSVISAENIFIEMSRWKLNEIRLYAQSAFTSFLFSWRNIRLE